MFHKSLCFTSLYVSQVFCPLGEIPLVKKMPRQKTIDIARRVGNNIIIQANSGIIKTLSTGNISEIRNNLKLIKEISDDLLLVCRRVKRVKVSKTEKLQCQLDEQTNTIKELQSQLSELRKKTEGSSGTHSKGTHFKALSTPDTSKAEVQELDSSSDSDSD